MQSYFCQVVSLAYCVNFINCFINFSLKKLFCFTITILPHTLLMVIKRETYHFHIDAFESPNI